MSTAAATAKAAAKNTAHHVTAASKSSARSDRHKLFHFVYEANPKPLNCAHHAATRGIATDPYHPFYIRTQRRLKDFDASKFHWNVMCPIDVSKKVVVRTWAKKRVRDTFRAELRSRGWGLDGAVLNEGESGEKKPLRGALAVWLDKDKSIVSADSEDVKRECATLLEQVVRLQEKAERKPASALRRSAGQRQNQRSNGTSHRSVKIEPLREGLND